MLFYKFIAFYEPDRNLENSYPGNRHRRYHQNREINEKLAIFNAKFHNRAYFCLETMNDGVINGAVISESKKLINDNIKSFVNICHEGSGNVEIEEITLKDLTDILESSCQNGYLKNDGKLLDNFDIENVYEGFHREIQFDENLISESTKKELYEQTENTMYAEDLLPELDRIYDFKHEKYIKGIPVHYIFNCKDEGDIRKNAYRTLISALYANNRLPSKRYMYLDIDPSDRASEYTLNRLYKGCVGGTLVIRYTATDDRENGYASANRDMIEKLSNLTKKYRNCVLTIICIPSECHKLKEMFYDCLESIDIVEINENLVANEMAEKYLRNIAKSQSLRTDKTLFEKLVPGKGYSSDELQNIFYEWYNIKLKRVFYPQYKDFHRTKALDTASKPKGSSYNRLMSMVGMEDAKKVINQAIDFFRAQVIFKDKGFKEERPSMSMVYFGNPGTGKTTFARLLGEILHEEGILENSNVVEVSKKDLCGLYVGHTAPLVHKKFMEAKNGVLVIDEAYALSQKDAGGFGIEAITQIVKEMEDLRDSTLVIFTGYKKEMEEFLDTNPGLRSRIAFLVPFNDYSVDELCRISTDIASQKGMTISDDAMLKMRGIYEEISKYDDYGNARAVRNILESAKMSMSSRLLKCNFDKLTKENVTTILAEDISAPVLTTVPHESRRVIGF